MKIKSFKFLLLIFALSIITFNFSQLNGINKVYASEQINYVCKIQDNYYTSLSQAVLAAQSGDTISFLADCVSDKIVINKNLNFVIDESVSKDITITRRETGDLVKVESGVSLSISASADKKFILSGDGIEQTGAFIFSLGNLSLSNVVINDTYTNSTGGAINFQGESLECVNCEFRNNNAQIGGAVYASNASSELTFTNTNFLYNEAETYGGAVKFSGSAEFVDCDFGFNVCSSYGGAISCEGAGVLVVKGCDFTLNSASYGAAIYTECQTTITTSNNNVTRIKNNAASKSGGAIYYSGDADTKTLLIEKNTEISENAAQDGGAIYCAKGKVSVVSSKLILNIASNNIYMFSGAIVLNDAMLDGYFYKSSLATITIENKMFTVNTSMAFEVEKTYANFDLLSVVGFNLNDSEKALLTECASEVGKTTFSQDGKVLNITPFVTFSIYIDGKKQEAKVPVGQVFVLSFVINSADKYVSKIVDENDVVYSLNDQIIASEDLTINVILSSKFIVTIDYRDRVVKKYVMPGENMVLPTLNALSQVVIDGWICGDNSVLAGENITINSSATFVAVYNNYSLVTFKHKDDVLSKKLYQNGSELVLTEGEEREDYRFAGWELDETLYEVNESIVVNGDITLSTVYVEQKKITYILNNEVYKVIGYDKGSEIELYGKGDENLKGYTRWGGELVEYSFGEKVVLNGDVTLVALKSRAPLIITICFISVILIAVIVYFLLKEKREQGKVDILGNIFK